MKKEESIPWSEEGPWRREEIVDDRIADLMALFENENLEKMVEGDSVLSGDEHLRVSLKKIMGPARGEDGSSKFLKAYELDIDGDLFGYFAQEVRPREDGTWDECGFLLANLHHLLLDNRKGKVTKLIAALKTGFNEPTWGKKKKMDVDQVLGKLAIPNAIAVEQIPDELLNDKRVALAIVSHAPWKFPSLPKKFRNDKDVVVAAVSRQRWLLEQASPKIRGDREIILALVAVSARSLQYASEELRDDKEVALAAANSADPCLGDVSERLLNDREVILTAVGRDPSQFTWAADKLKKNKRFVLEVVKRGGRALESADPKLQSDKEVVLAAVSNDGRALEFASEELRKDREVCAAAIRQSADAVEFADGEVLSDREIALEAVRRQGPVFKYFSPSIHADREIALVALSNCNREIDRGLDEWDIFSCLPKKLKEDREIAKIVVSRKGLSIFDDELPEKCRNDLNIVCAALEDERSFTSSSDNVKHIGAKLMKDKDSVMTMFSHQPLILGFLSPALQLNEEDYARICGVKNLADWNELSEVNTGDEMCHELVEKLEGSFEISRMKPGSKKVEAGGLERLNIYCVSSLTTKSTQGDQIDIRVFRVATWYTFAVLVLIEKRRQGKAAQKEWLGRIVLPVGPDSQYRAELPQLLESFIRLADPGSFDFLDDAKPDDDDDD